MSIVATIGVDLGQKRDPTSIVVAELTAERVGQRLRYRHVVRHLERLPLGTSYPAVAARIAAIVRSVAHLARVRGSSTAASQAPTAAGLIYRSAAGVAGGRRQGLTGGPERAGWGQGAPQATRTPPAAPTAASVRLLVDSTGVGQPVVDLIRAAGIVPTPAYFNHGDKLVSHADGSLGVGKGFLVSRLQALLQSRRFLLPESPEARALAAELMTFELRVSQNGSDTYGAFKTGAHDDLVTALGLAVLREPTPFRAAAGGTRTALLPDPDRLASDPRRRPVLLVPTTDQLAAADLHRPRPPRPLGGFPR